MPASRVSTPHRCWWPPTFGKAGPIHLLLLIGLATCEPAAVSPNPTAEAPASGPSTPPVGLDHLSTGQSLPLKLAACPTPTADCVGAQLSTYLPKPSNPRDRQAMHQAFDGDLAELERALANATISTEERKYLIDRLAERHAFVTYLGSGAAPRLGAQGVGPLPTAARTAWALEAARLFSRGPNAGDPNPLIGIWHGTEPVPRGEPGSLDGCAWSGEIAGSAHLPGGQTRPTSSDPDVDARLAILAAVSRFGATFAHLQPFSADPAPEVATFARALIRRRPPSEPGISVFFENKPETWAEAEGGPGMRCGQHFWPEP